MVGKKGWHAMVVKLMNSLGLTMARIRNKEYKKNAAVCADNIQKAAAKILSGEMSFRKAAAVYNVSKTTLNRHVSTFKKSEQPNLNFKYVSKIQSRKIFTDDEEGKLRKNFTANEIYNLDESRLLTVHVPPKVIAGKNIKQVGQMMLEERGKLVTIISAVNAIGNTVPPLFVFPRKFFKDHMLKEAPTGTIGATNPSDWSPPQIFMLHLKHFVKHVKTSKNNNIILIIDNHHTHITIEAIKFSKENGIICPLTQVINFNLWIVLCLALLKNIITVLVVNGCLHMLGGLYQFMILQNV
ncbi:hypothetical protein AVEN_120850-1 [Araneus ventricosus]|uniref:HTH psq-type domain-containing protein n=1 Tax=Araneus ventricosus TaxID=182803 RepID=A0A4Y2MXJ9_ARAVE|nr:hypothetical protein AVEN_120850-1 [Araneus ventricosus]